MARVARRPNQGGKGELALKDTRSLKEKLGEVAESQKLTREEAEDRATIARIRAMPTWQELLEQKLHPDIEGQLRKKFHLERPAAVTTSSQSSEDQLRQTRRRLRGSD
jgi:hypothetical protein